MVSWRTNKRKDMITEIKYLEAKKIVDTYNEQLNIPLVIWRCTQDLFLDDGQQVFTSGQEYKQYDKQSKYWVINDHKVTHGIGVEWRKHFTAI